MRPVRVLYASGGALDFGGITSFMLSYASRFDREQVAVDFLVHGMQEGPREQEAAALGAKIWHVPYKRDHYLKNRAAVREVLFTGGYEIVHAHMDGMNGSVLAMAKAAGIPARISHCHNTGFLTGNPVKARIHRMAADRIPSVATDLMACSPEAGRFLYGTHPFSVIPNAIEPGRFRFSPEKREAFRNRYGADADTLVAGCVARYDDVQKNQLFLLDAFRKALEDGGKRKLLLIGEGPDRPKLEERIRALGLEGKAVLTGSVGDIPGILSALDLFCLPSRFEGLGIVLIEAQAAGLPCIASDPVPRCTEVTGCSYLPLEQETWAAAIRSAVPARERTVDPERFAEAGYDIDAEALKLQRFYLEKRL